MFIGTTGKSKSQFRINERAVVGKYTLVKLVIFGVIDERDSKMSRVKPFAWLDVIWISQVTNELEVMKPKGDSVIEYAKWSCSKNISIKAETLLKLI